MSTGLPRPGLARSAHHGRIKFLRGYVSKSSAAVNRPTHDHAASLSEVVRLDVNVWQLANHACTSNCTWACAEGLHFSAFHYRGSVQSLVQVWGGIIYTHYIRTHSAQTQQLSPYLESRALPQSHCCTDSLLALCSSHSLQVRTLA